MVVAAGDGAVAAGIVEAVVAVASGKEIEESSSGDAGPPCAMIVAAAAGDGAVAAGAVAAVAASVAVAAVANCNWSCCNCQLPIANCI